MMFTASSYHRGIIPEVDALSGNRIAPWMARKNGGLAALNEAVSEKINGQIISWIAGVSFVLYLSGRGIWSGILGYSCKTRVQQCLLKDQYNPMGYAGRADC